MSKNTVPFPVIETHAPQFPPDASFGEALDYYLKLAGLNQNRLAFFIAINQSMINKLANGRIKHTNPRIILRITLTLSLNREQTFDLMSRLECTLSPADPAYQAYLYLIDIYSEKTFDFSDDETFPLIEADEYLESKGFAPLPTSKSSE